MLQVAKIDSQPRSSQWIHGEPEVEDAEVDPVSWDHPDDSEGTGNLGGPKCTHQAEMDENPKEQAG